MTAPAAVRTVPMLVLLGLLAACATTNPRRGMSASDRLTREEIAGAQGARNLYEVVERLRPRWLVVRSADRLNLSAGIVVFQDQTYLGSAEILRQFSPDMYYEMRWLDGAVASATLPGLHPDHPVAGAIVLFTRSQEGG